jgi:hypothetical protein
MKQQGHALSPGLDSDHLRFDRRRPFRIVSNESVPHGFMSALRRRTPRRGERRLALAVLEDAVRRLRNTRRASRFLPRPFRGEAQRWIESRDRTGLFAFENVCRILSLDPDQARTRILPRTSPGA